MPTQNLTWSLIKPPIVYEENATLFCNTSTVPDCKTSWMKGTSVIVHQGATVNPSKYIELKVLDGYLLIITNISTSDINVSYTCLADRLSYQELLLVSEDNFLVKPKNETTKVEFFQTETQLDVNISFQKIFPEPKCVLLFQDEKVGSRNTVSLHKNGMFSEGTIQLSHQFTTTCCHGIFTVICKLCEQVFKIGSISVQQECHETLYMPTGIIIGLSVPVVLGTLYIIYYCVQRPNRDEQTQSSNGDCRNRCDIDNDIEKHRDGIAHSSDNAVLEKRSMLKKSDTNELDDAVQMTELMMLSDDSQDTDTVYPTGTILLQY